MRRSFTRTFALAIVVAAIAAPGASAKVGAGTLKLQAQPAPTHSSGFRGGVFVATGDLDGDGTAMTVKLENVFVSS